MGQSRIPEQAVQSAFSPEEVTRMVGVLVRKYGEQAPQIAHVMSRQHLKVGDVARFRAWKAVAKRVQLIALHGPLH